MKKVFVDTNVIVDVLDNREQFVVESANVLEMGFQGSVELYTSAMSFATCLYLTRRSLGKEGAADAIRTLRQYIHISPITEQEFDKAFSKKAADYEDMLQYHSALSAGCEVIVTRNEKHFPKDAILIASPHDFLTTPAEPSGLL